MRDLAYLELLAAQYPTERAALGEMLRLEAVQRLPKGTELFLSDVHGEDEAFTHLINNASGIIDEKIMKALPELPERERHVLCSLITYPHEQLLRMEACRLLDGYIETNNTELLKRLKNLLKDS